MRKILLIVTTFFISTLAYPLVNSEFKVIESKSTLNKEELKLDINNATKKEMLGAGISKGFVDKLLEYRDITGGFVKLKDMVRISGIGQKTYERLSKEFNEPKDVKLKKFNINSSNDKVLLYYGFTKTEIKKIREYQEKEIIRNNNDIKKIISEKKYDKLKNYIEY